VNGFEGIALARRAADLVVPAEARSLVDRREIDDMPAKGRKGQILLPVLRQRRMIHLRAYRSSRRWAARR